LKRNHYEKLLEPMQAELVGMARWVAASGQRLLVLFEGRDTAGKGGAIQAVASRLNPRQCRTIALPKASEAEAACCLCAVLGGRSGAGRLDHRIQLGVENGERVHRLVVDRRLEAG